VIGLFLLPVHYYTHVLLIFFSGIWATNIHDAVVSPAVLTFRLSLAYSAYMDDVRCSGPTSSRSWAPSTTPCTTRTTTTTSDR
jgi:hypothetical protein